MRCHLHSSSGSIFQKRTMVEACLLACLLESPFLRNLIWPIYSACFRLLPFVSMTEYFSAGVSIQLQDVLTGLYSQCFLQRPARASPCETGE